jgi:hypothetical protein
VKANVNDAIAVGNQISVQVINPNGRAVTKSAVDNGPPSALATLAGGGRAPTSSLSIRTPESVKDIPLLWTAMTPLEP